MKRGHAVWVASSGGKCREAFEETGIACVDIPLRTKAVLDPRVAVSAFVLSRFIREKKVGIIHAQTRVSQAASCLASRLTGVVYLSTCHGFFRPRLPRRLFPCWGRRIIAISGQVERHLIDDFGVDAARVRLVLNGVDTLRFAPSEAAAKESAKVRFGLAGRKVVGIVGRLSSIKGHADLLRAMEIVAQAEPQSALLIAGDGSEGLALEALAETPGLSGRVVFAHTLTDVAGAYAAMDVFAMPSRAEGLGLSLMEAMAAGLPVVGSSVGGIVSLISDGRTGMLVPPADPARLAESLVYVLTHQREAASFGQRARALIEERFSKGQMIEKTEEVYRECLGERA